MKTSDASSTIEHPSKALGLKCSNRLGVGHDGSAGCPDGKFIMSKATPGGKDACKWSSCSSNTLQAFLG